VEVLSAGLKIVETVLFVAEGAGITPLATVFTTALFAKEQRNKGKKVVWR
jgi:hypothetical protein